MAENWEEVASQPEARQQAAQQEYENLSRQHASMILAGKPPPQEMLRRLVQAARESGNGVRS